MSAKGTSRPEQSLGTASLREMLDRAQDPQAYKEALKKAGPLRLKGFCDHNPRTPPLLEVYGHTLRIGVATYPLEHHSKPVEVTCGGCKVTWDVDLPSIRALLRPDRDAPAKRGVRAPKMSEIARPVVPGRPNHNV